MNQHPLLSTVFQWWGLVIDDSWCWFVIVDHNRKWVITHGDWWLVRINDCHLHDNCRWWWLMIDNNWLQLGKTFDNNCSNDDESDDRWLLLVGVMRVLYLMNWIDCCWCQGWIMTINGNWWLLKRLSFSSWIVAKWVTLLFEIRLNCTAIWSANKCDKLGTTFPLLNFW
jgi:hypothetical protein